MILFPKEFHIFNIFIIRYQKFLFFSDSEPNEGTQKNSNSLFFFSFQNSKISSLISSTSISNSNQQMESSLNVEKFSQNNNKNSSLFLWKKSILINSGETKFQYLISKQSTTSHHKPFRSTKNLKKPYQV